jgi:hypothetical protein
MMLGGFFAPDDPHRKNCDPPPVRVAERLFGLQLHLTVAGVSAYLARQEPSEPDDLITFRSLLERMLS